MINSLIDFFKDKKVLILGFGREGISTYKLIRRYLKEQILYIADSKEIDKEDYEFLKNDKNIVLKCGENYLNNLEDYDVIMKSPGISFLGLDTSKFKDKIKSELELLLEYFNNFTIGITGTKGKSTTTSLIYKMIKDQNKKVMLLGNIGIPAFDYIDKIEDDMILVLEMSSYQLEYLKKSPNIAILLNLFEEHLNYHGSFENYAIAKCNIFKYQNENDYFIYNVENENLKKFVSNNKANTYKISFNNKEKANTYIKDENVYINDKKIYNINEKRNLLGEYNLNNIMFVLTVSEILKLDIDKTIKSISEFKTLEHRLEFVGKFNDVYYYDNSIATIPMATIEAVKALKDVDTLIIGGMDRGIDYSSFIEFLNESSIRNVICMPKTGHDIAKELKKGKAYVVNTMEEAVDTAKRVTKKEGKCLLSPAAASYGFFKNFEEKGDIYKSLVRS